MLWLPQKQQKYIFICLFPSCSFQCPSCVWFLFYCLFINYMHLTDSIRFSSPRVLIMLLYDLVIELRSFLRSFLMLNYEHWWRVIHMRLLGLSGGSTLASFRHSRGICNPGPYPCQYLSLRVPRIPKQDEHLYGMPWCPPGFSLRDFPFIPSAATNEGCQWLTAHPLSWIRPLLKEAASPEVTLLHEAAHANDGSSNLASIREFWMAIPAPTPCGTSLWGNSTVNFSPHPILLPLLSFRNYSWEPLPVPIPNKPPAVNLRVRVYFLGKQPMKIPKTNEHTVISMVINSNRSLPTHRVERSPWVDGWVYSGPSLHWR